MKNIQLSLSFVLSVLLCAAAVCATESDYPNNRAPLAQKPYVELPLGSIKAKGWLLEMLQRQKTGATSRMDVLYPQVMGPRNGWLGGDGDQWERGPYWIDGLLPLAYLLDDKELKEKARPWVEWILGSQREDGFFGPAKNYEREPGLQRNNSEDWWPRMVALKILQQHYSATRDERVIGFMTKYFQYQLKTLPEKPIDNWTFWAKYRAGDNLQAVYWLYNMTGDSFLLELGELLHKQAHDYAGMFLKGEALAWDGVVRDRQALHCVNLAQGIKEPLVYYQQNPDRKYLEAVKKGFADIRRFHGQAQGMYGGDEALHGNNPTQGSELCAAVELMYSLETMLGITGDLAFADHLERIAFNALPAQTTDDYMNKQYFQQANQVMVTRHTRNFDVNHGGTDLVFGLLSGYPCCASNMHQGWPKFTRNLWFSTPDKGLAALVYSPSEISAKVNGRRIKISEETAYPMDDTIRFTVRIEDDANKDAQFPLHLRIPGWCKDARITINGKTDRDSIAGGQVAVVNRSWKNGDVLELQLPMTVTTDTWYGNSISVERGPLVYALRMEEQWTEKTVPAKEAAYYGGTYYEVSSPDKWNYGIINYAPRNAAKHFKVEIDPAKQKSDFFWNPESAPIQIKVKAREIPHWSLYNEMSGPVPYSGKNVGGGKTPLKEITLIPYGCTTLRISQFPVTK